MNNYRIISRTDGDVISYIVQRENYNLTGAIGQQTLGNYVQPNKWDDVRMYHELKDAQTCLRYIKTGLRRNEKVVG